jgi:LmbE family N-acetylglucosaminyl deacetylase
MKKVRRLSAQSHRLRSRSRRFFERQKRHFLKKLQPVVVHIQSVAEDRWFHRLYPIFGLAVLLITTTFWALLGARINLENADQLVNPYLLENANTFHNALLPGSHSFLIKWPLFWLVKVLGYSSNAYICVTLGIVLATVTALAYILYRIERRPLVYGTILLAMASVLMLVPTTSYVGALLPVNMAMLTTRNIEYIIFIVAVALIMRAKRLFALPLWLGIALLAVLIASDKLFLSLSIGGAVLALMAYGLSTGWNLVSTNARWIFAGLISGIAATATLWLITIRHITHIVSGEGVGPYGLINNAHDLVIGGAYGVLHIFTNFGANPAAQTMLLQSVPHDALHNFIGWSILAYTLNLIVFIVVLFGAFQILRHSLAHNKDKNIWLNRPAKLSIALVWTAVAAIGIFVVSNHYYAADARYLTIVFFGLFIAGVTFISRKQFSATILALTGILFFIGIALSIPNVISAYHKDVSALDATHQRNERISQALKQHSVKVLVGDYWRVIPIRSLMSHAPTIMPLANCTTPRDTLTSTSWQPDLTKNSFAYILTFDGSATDFPHCSIDQVTTAYGKPNASIVVAGSIAHPKELILFYDRGAHKSAPVSQPEAPSTVTPGTLDNLPSTICKQPTIMNIVAHEDDDLLFMNPDLLHDIKAGNCVRTIYVTAGDAGSNIFYWIRREQGSQAAYASMLGFKDIWVQRVVNLGNNQYATVATPRGNTNISLVYLHLPDGNMKGQGFSAHHNETLAALDAGSSSSIHDVYNGSTYTKDQLIHVLSTLMLAYQPTEIHTQSNFGSAGGFSDHSDHMAVGRLVQKAYDIYETDHFANRVTIPLKFYVGYPIHAQSPNVSGADLEAKENAFSAYIQFDPGACHSMVQCVHDPAYGAYLPRQYQRTY